MEMGVVGRMVFLERVFAVSAGSVAAKQQGGTLDRAGLGKVWDFRCSSGSLFSAFIPPNPYDLHPQTRLNCSYSTCRAFG
jgi:hypothetical protein